MQDTVRPARNAERLGHEAENAVGDHIDGVDHAPRAACHHLAPQLREQEDIEEQLQLARGEAQMRQPLDGDVRPQTA